MIYIPKQAHIESSRENSGTQGRDVGVLLQHYTASANRKPGLEP